MKLLTKALRKTIPPLYATEMQQDPTIWVKFFMPWCSWTYYVLEFDGQDTVFGWVEGVDTPELGYSSLSEMERVVGPFGLKVERDRFFTPCPLSTVCDQPRDWIPAALSSQETCAYGDDTPAVKWCFACGRPLCSFCGVRDTDNRPYCNECWAAHEERAGVARAHEPK